MPPDSLRGEGPEPGWFCVCDKLVGGCCLRVPTVAGLEGLLSSVPLAPRVPQCISVDGCEDHGAVKAGCSAGSRGRHCEGTERFSHQRDLYCCHLSGRLQATPP